MFASECSSYNLQQELQAQRSDTKTMLVTWNKTGSEIRLAVITCLLCVACDQPQYASQVYQVVAMQFELRNQCSLTIWIWTIGMDGVCHFLLAAVTSSFIKNTSPFLPVNFHILFSYYTSNHHSFCACADYKSIQFWLYGGCRNTSTE